MNLLEGVSFLHLNTFQFSGQSGLDTWTLKDRIDQDGWTPYAGFLNHEPVLCFETIRDLATHFPTHQPTPDQGRPPIPERTQLIAMLVRQFLDATFRELRAWLELLQDVFDLPHVPADTTMSEKNRTPRFANLLERFHAWILDHLPLRDVVVATDATGYSNRKQAWSETPYGLRATQDWVKVHAAIDCHTQLYLTTVHSESDVHESQVFPTVWNSLPEDADVKRSLADNAYTGEACLQVVRDHDATPLHDLRDDHRYERSPKTAYEKLVNFATHWPNRFRRLTALRKLAEAVFHSTKQTFGHRLRCRDPVARRNEVRAKRLAHNVRVLARRAALASH
jgi:transposase